MAEESVKLRDKRGHGGKIKGPFTPRVQKRIGKQKSYRRSPTRGSRFKWGETILKKGIGKRKTIEEIPERWRF